MKRIAACEAWTQDEEKIAEQKVELKLFSNRFLGRQGTL
jgi:hypothetical protein